MYDININYKTLSKKDQLLMIRNKYKKLKKEYLDPVNDNCSAYCGGRMLIVKEILDDVYKWDADTDCSY